MSKAPSLRRVEDALSLIRRRVPELTENARWAWPMGYQRRKGEPQMGGGDVNRPTEAAVGHESYRCERGCPTHPRGGAFHRATPEWTIRGEVEQIGKRVLQAAALLEGAMAAFDRIARAAGQGDRPSAPKEELLLRVANKSDVEKAKTMKRWRDEQRQEEQRKTRGAWGYGDY